MSLTAKTNGATYKKLRMLRLKFSGTDAKEQFSIITEFNLQEQFKEQTNLQVKKEAYEDTLLKLKYEMDASSSLSTGSKNKLKVEEKQKSFDELSKELKAINKQLKKFDTDKINVEEYYQQLVKILTGEDLPFDEIDLAEVNKMYTDFFSLLNNSLKGSQEK
jgi:hypothetical protein